MPYGQSVPEASRLAAVQLIRRAICYSPSVEREAARRHAEQRASFGILVLSVEVVVVEGRGDRLLTLKNRNRELNLARIVVFAFVAGRAAMCSRKLARETCGSSQIFKADGIGRGKNICFPIRGQPVRSLSHYSLSPSLARSRVCATLVFYDFDRRAHPTHENGRQIKVKKKKKEQTTGCADVVFRSGNTRANIAAFFISLAFSLKEWMNINIVCIYICIMYV